MNNSQSLIKIKLFNLKKWLTIEESAKYLSIMFDEDVSEADVLRLGLDKHLKLSVNFVNYAYALKGEKFLEFDQWKEKIKRVISWQNARFHVFKDNMVTVLFPGVDTAFSFEDEKLTEDYKLGCFEQPDEIKRAFLKKKSSESQANILAAVFDQSVIEHQKKSEEFEGLVPPSTDSFKEKIESIKGVWDLPMLGAERLDIEHKYQMLKKGPEVTLIALDGAIVENEEGVLYQLQEPLAEDPSLKNPDELDDFEKAIVAGGTITEERLLEKKKERANRPFRHPDNFFPSPGLPDDSVLVVRTQALIDLQKHLSQTDPSIKANLDKRAETTYLNIIGAMLEIFVHKNHGNADFPSEAKLREFLSKKYDGFRGLAERTLAEKFAAAKKSINDNLD